MSRKNIGYILIILLALSFFNGCSSVFTASIDGQILDFDAREKGTVQGVADATIWLYTQKDKRDADYDFYREGEEPTTPSGSAKTSTSYFLSTTSDTNGRYQFAGIIWETNLPEFGKTADRKEVWLLVYHPDYGLHKNPQPLFLVSDVSNQFSPFTIPSLWSERQISGRVLSWAEENKGLGNVDINLRIPKRWEYSETGEPKNIIWKDGPTYETTTNADGLWSISAHFSRQPGHSDTVHKALAHITWDRENWQAGEIGREPPLNAGVLGNLDLNKNGISAEEGDPADWYLETNAFGTDKNDGAFFTGDIEMMRWRFSANLQGEVEDSNGEKLNGVSLVLLAGSRELGRTSSQSLDGLYNIEKGRFNFGTLEWTLDDLQDDDEAKKSGAVAVELKALKADDTVYTIIGEGIEILYPDESRTIIIKVSP